MVVHEQPGYNFWLSATNFGCLYITKVCFVLQINGYSPDTDLSVQTTAPLFLFVWQLYFGCPGQTDNHYQFLTLVAGDLPYSVFQITVHNTKIIPPYSQNRGVL